MAVTLLDIEAFLAADESFVELNDAARAAHGRKIAVSHSLADAMAEKPSGFHAARRVRWIWLVDMPFLLAHIRWMICSQRCNGRWELSKMVP